MYPFVAPLATPEAEPTLLKAAFRPTDAIELALNVMVVKSEDRLVLLDTGMGIFADPVTQGWLPKRLADAGFSAAAVTDVIVSHAYSGHIGGLVDKRNNPVFANADLHLAKIEYDFWQAATHADFKKSPCSRYRTW